MVKETVNQFNKQWSIYQHEGYSDHVDYFNDVLGPLLDIKSITGKKVADVGAGNGRFTETMAQYALQVLSIEPGTDTMNNNKARNMKYPNVTFINKKAEDLEPLKAVDFVFCIGVLHHIPDMERALKGMITVLKSGGKIVLWVYGLEGNRLYVAFLKIVKFFTTKIPDNFLVYISKLLVKPVKICLYICKRLKWMPMSGYDNRVIKK